MVVNASFPLFLCPHTIKTKSHIKKSEDRRQNKNHRKDAKDAERNKQPKCKTEPRRARRKTKEVRVLILDLGLGMRN
jgi:hypothetical protein